MFLKNIRRKGAAAVAVAAMVLLMASCRSSQSAVSSYTGSGGSSVPELPQSSPAAQLFAANAVEWDDLKLPVSVSVTEPTKLSVSGTLTMVRDKSVDLSLRMLGFEVAAMHIEGDSVTAMVKVNKVYLRESISKMFGGLGVSVADVQNAILGKPFLPEAIGVKAEELVVTENSPWVFVSALEPSGKAELVFKFAAADSGLESTTLTASGKQMSLTYGNKIGSGAESMPGLITVSGTTSGKKLAATLTLNYNKAELNTGATTKPLSIPSGYRQIQASSLLKSL